MTPRHSLVKQTSDHYLPGLIPHEHDADSEDDAKARNVVMNFDGLGVVWYTSANSSFESSKAGSSSEGTQAMVSRPLICKESLCSLHLRASVLRCTRRSSLRGRTRTSCRFAPTRRPESVAVISGHHRARQSLLSTIIHSSLVGTLSCTMAPQAVSWTSSEVSSMR